MGPVLLPARRSPCDSPPEATAIVDLRPGAVQISTAVSQMFCASPWSAKKEAGRSAMSRPIAVSEADIAAYHRDGAVVLKGVLDADELRLLAEGVDQVHAHPGPRSSVVRSPEGEGETLVLNYPTTRSAALRELMDRGVIAEAAGRVMRTPSAQLVFEQIFYKT